MSILRLIKNQLPKGDTIVEVMISMSVLGIVLGAAYQAATSSFQSGLDSQYRDQAVSYGQQQVELLKEADNNNPPTISTYTAPTEPFCINPSDGSVLYVSHSNDCLINNLYTVSVTYDHNNPSTKTFDITTSWSSATGRPQQAELFYKTNDSFINPHGYQCQGSCTKPPTPPPGADIVVYINGQVSPDNVNYGDQVTITWQTQNIQHNSCSARSSPPLAGWNGSKADSNLSPGEKSAPLKVRNPVTFTLTCTSAGGSNKSGSSTVAVNPPKPSLTINPTNQQIGKPVNIGWSAGTGGSSCTANSMPDGLWTTSGKRSGNTTSSNLTMSSTFSVTCNYFFGLTSTSDSITVTVY